jgi:L-malate glycosyltransferase
MSQLASGHGALLVLVPDRLSDLVRKGEITDRYYNPGNLFDEVHIVLVNDDRPDPAALQRMVGSARLHVHNIPAGKGLFVRSIGWRPWLLDGWAGAAVELARSIRPVLIRCHGALINAYAAYRIKMALGIPYVVSLHINPDVDVRGRSETWRHRLMAYAQQDVERIALHHADLVMPVYLPIVPYLRRLNITRYEVCYNVLNPEHLGAKRDYSLHDPVRMISVGRQFKEKNPENIIRAVARMSRAQLLLVGDGPLHDHLRRIAEDCGAADRVVMRRSVPNDELCRILPDHDIFAVHTEYWELSKSVIEPLLTGLPVVINRRIGEPVPELSADICVLVENSVEGYLAAFERLATDGGYRERIGRAAFRHAQANWAPRATEAKFAGLYRRVMATRST